MKLKKFKQFVKENIEFDNRNIENEFDRGNSMKFDNNNSDEDDDEYNDHMDSNGHDEWEDDNEFDRNITDDEDYENDEDDDEDDDEDYEDDEDDDEDYEDDEDDDEDNEDEDEEDDIEEEGQYKGESEMNELADMLGAKVVNNQIEYNGKKINFFSETEKFHVDKKKFDTKEEVIDYLEGNDTNNMNDEEREMALESRRFNRKRFK